MAQLPGRLLDQPWLQLLRCNRSNSTSSASSRFSPFLRCKGRLEVILGSFFSFRHFWWIWLKSFNFTSKYFWSQSATCGPASTSAGVDLKKRRWRRPWQTSGLEQRGIQSRSSHSCLAVAAPHCCRPILSPNFRGNLCLHHLKQHVQPLYDLRSPATLNTSLLHLICTYHLPLSSATTTLISLDALACFLLSSSWSSWLRIIISS